MRSCGSVFIAVGTSVCAVLLLLSLAMVQPASAAEPIRIGALMSMTGPAGFVGANVKEAIVALVDDLNRKGGVLGRQI
jgi:branched-chain amino acid transport system substrate-binding protein